ncbi:hypothetical protein StoSoilB3_11310 [Arthrobacter sp. StoSoilB3]|nr:hypothetical protein StoSoilB3_11310 [Arthrobacter sp. StoSoilB3]
MPKDVRDIFQNYAAGPLNSENFENFEEEPALQCVFEAELLACFREWLARKSCRKDIMVGHRLGYQIVGVQFAHIKPWRDAKVAFVERVQGGFPFGREYALAAKVAECYVEPTEPSE